MRIVKSLRNLADHHDAFPICEAVLVRTKGEKQCFVSHMSAGIIRNIHPIPTYFHTFKSKAATNHGDSLNNTIKQWHMTTVTLVLWPGMSKKYHD